MKRWARKLHRWGALIAAIPLLLVIVTGLLLQIKKQSPWIQPPTQRGSDKIPTVNWETILASARSIKLAEVSHWSDIERLDVQPNKGIIKIQCQNHWELQIDAATGAVLSSNYRRSDWIESLHDGSFFADAAKLCIFFPNGLILLGLWISGAYLWWLPIGVRRNKKKRNPSVL